MTSLFRELVSVPTEPCFSISTVDAPSLDCSFCAIASPTTPPPITACVKSASLLRLVENALELNDFEMEDARKANMLKDSRIGYNSEQGNNEHIKCLQKQAFYSTSRKKFVLISDGSVAFPMTLPNRGDALAIMSISDLKTINSIGIISRLTDLNTLERISR